MSVFQSSTASFNPVINEAVNAVDRQQFVGTRILPIQNTPSMSGKYVKVTAAQFDNDVSKPRAAGSNFSQTSSEYGSGSFACEQYGVENAIDSIDLQKAESDALYDVATAAAKRLADNLMVGHELRVASQLSSASFNSTAATAVMSNASTATPIADVNNAVQRLYANGQFTGIHLIIESSLYQEMTQTDDMRNLINGSGALAYSTDQVAKVLGVEGVIICNTRYNSAAKGQAASRAKVWPTTSYYVASVQGGALANGGIGRTLSYNELGGAFTTETFRTEQPPASVVRVSQCVDEIIINDSAGEKITGA